MSVLPINRSNRQVVQFDDTPQICTFVCHQDQDKEENNGACHELWYIGPELNSIRRATFADIDELRARVAAGARLSYEVNDDDADDVSWLGIERLVIPALALETRACVDRCIDAVLSEQGRHGSSEIDIALASFAQSRRAAQRAMRLAEFLQDSM
mgnify:CR=1 FL=1